MIFKLTCVLLATSLGFGLAIGGSPQESGKKRQDTDSKKQDETASFMKRKLNASREIVAGLTTEDFEKIDKNAQDLMLLSHESNWTIFQTESYLQMSADFRGSAKRIRENAKKENLDGATLAYFEMTLSCVRCHKYIRNKRKSGRK